jgi:hypothetical protein
VKFAVVIACVALAGCSPQPAPQPATAKEQAAPVPALDTRFDAKFWSVWGDGKAEVNTYDLTFPRYNQKRKGVAIAIFVTEPFSDSARVKADPGKHPNSDVVPVMKLNLIKKFQTGIYDYSDVASTFVSLAPVDEQPAGSTLKASFSSQEWCGHVYSQMLFGRRHIGFTQHSYFDGEADQQSEISSQPDGIAEDALLLWARGIARPWNKTTASTPIMTSLETLRAKHVGPSWSTTTLSTDASPQTIRVGAGKFEVDVLRSKRADGTSRTFYVEKSSPSRVIKWETSDGESAVLRATERLKYWEMNHEGGESALSGLGLPRVAPLIQ